MAKEGETEKQTAPAKSDNKPRKGKRLLLAVLILMLLGGATVGGFYIYRKADKTDDKQQDNTGPEIIPSGGINISTTQEIDKISDPEERFKAYSSAAADFNFQGEHVKALEYYKLALAIENVDKDLRNNTALSARGLAQVVGNQEYVDYFSSLLDPAVIAEYEAAIQKGNNETTED